MQLPCSRKRPGKTHKQRKLGVWDELFLHDGISSFFLGKIATNSSDRTYSAHYLIIIGRKNRGAKPKNSWMSLCVHLNKEKPKHRSMLLPLICDFFSMYVRGKQYATWLYLQGSGGASAAPPSIIVAQGGRDNGKKENVMDGTKRLRCFLHLKHMPLKLVHFAGSGFAHRHM